MSNHELLERAETQVPLLRLTDITLPLSQRIPKDHANRLVEPPACTEPGGQRVLRFGDGYRQLIKRRQAVSTYSDDHHSQQDCQITHSGVDSEAITTHYHFERGGALLDNSQDVRHCRKTTNSVRVVNKPWLTPNRSSEGIETSMPWTNASLNERLKRREYREEDNSSHHRRINQESGLVEPADLKPIAYWSNTPEAEFDACIARVAEEYKHLHLHIIALNLQLQRETSDIPRLLSRSHPRKDHGNETDSQIFKFNEAKLENEAHRSSFGMLAWDQLLADVIIKSNTMHEIRWWKILNSEACVGWAQWEVNMRRRSRGRYVTSNNSDGRDLENCCLDETSEDRGFERKVSWNDESRYTSEDESAQTLRRKDRRRLQAERFARRFNELYIVRFEEANTIDGDGEYQSDSGSQLDL